MTERTLRRTLGFADCRDHHARHGDRLGHLPRAERRAARDGRSPESCAIAVWVVGGVLSLLGALTYAELGAAKPDAGGLYAYLRDAFGPLPAFLYGWTSFLVIASGSIATLAVAFSNYLGQLVPLVARSRAKIVSALVIAVIAAINIRGTRESAIAQNWTTGVKVGGLIVLSICLDRAELRPHSAERAAGCRDDVIARRASAAR